MTDIAASLGIEQLKKLDRFNNERVRIANFYSATLQRYEEFLLLPNIPPDNFHSFYGYPIVVKTNAPFTRHELINYLEDNNIETRAYGWRFV